jgi:Transcription elongation factor, GreA/GreB, C-term
MSVAFRRESDDEHKEPRFELPIPPGPNWVTPRGLALLAAKVAEFEAMPRGVDTPAAPDPVLRQLRYWRTRLSTAQPAPAPADGEAGIGSWIAFAMNGKKREITIVGHDEALPDAGLLSFHAPLAQALLGSAVGDRLDFGGKASAIQVVAVAPDPNSVLPET